MKRTDITELFPDATKEQIDKLMGINGADINAAKGELDGIKTQLGTAQSELKKLKESATPPDKLQEAAEAISALQNELNGMKHAESVRQLREKISGEKKVPASLLTGETEEACAAQADAIIAFAKSSGYPTLPDGGEASHAHGTSTRDSFAVFAESQLT